MEDSNLEDKIQCQHTSLELEWPWKENKWKRYLKKKKDKTRNYSFLV